MPYHSLTLSPRSQCLYDNICLYYYWLFFSFFFFPQSHVSLAFFFLFSLHNNVASQRHRGRSKMFGIIKLVQSGTVLVEEGTSGVSWHLLYFALFCFFPPFPSPPIRPSLPPETDTDVPENASPWAVSQRCRLSCGLRPRKPIAAEESGC